MILFLELDIKSQAPDVPELAYPVLSVPQDDCESHNNFLKIFSKNYTIYDHKDDFFNKNQTLFQFFSGLKTALDVDRYLFEGSSSCENVSENFE